MLQYVREYSSKKYLKKLVKMAALDKGLTESENGEDKSAADTAVQGSSDQPDVAKGGRDSPDSPKAEMGLEGKVPALLMDRVFREITYSIHSEFVALLCPSEVDEPQANHQEFLENNPKWMTHEVNK